MRLRVVLPAALIMLLFPAAASASYPHVVQRGETLTSVAATDGLSIAAIAAANGISTQAQLVAGRILWIPPQTLETAGAGAATTATNASAVAQIQSDPDSDSDTDSAATEVTTTSTRSSNVQAQTTAQATAAPVPTLERVSASEIASIAYANGVPAALAEAIAWQESGWNNDEVSGVGAVGVMQIVPATWTWIDHYLTPSDPLGTASAAENIRAGVLLLHQLLQVSGGNESLAVAGYFQGIASVKAHGMYAATRQYVSDVLALSQRL
jgi:soluble lytic murein transglycosylase-like protein